VQIHQLKALDELITTEITRGENKNGEEDEILKNMCLIYSKNNTTGCMNNEHVLIIFY
jgi:hypothetical protein